MPKPRVTPLLLLTMLGAGVWALWPRTETEMEIAADHTAMSASTPMPTVDSRAEKNLRRAPAVPSLSSSPRIVEFLTPERRAVAPGARPVALSADAEALTAETIALQLLATDTELELNARQWTALATATLKIQAVRQAYEASIATVTPAAPGRTRVEIPTYAAAGDALREKFYAELRAQLGEANAAEILAQLGRKLEGHFGGFGVSVQTIDLARDAAGNDVITRTVQYWNSVEGQNRLTTRREMHFPGSEDPTGETWRPLLALVRG